MKKLVQMQDLSSQHAKMGQGQTSTHAPGPVIKRYLCRREEPGRQPAALGQEIVESRHYLVPNILPVPCNTRQKYSISHGPRMSPVPCKQKDNAKYTAK
jgi:hypothetical protein